MKILELRFKNLNSLYGEWKIDFNDPEYLANGIFALTGPTGVGKSTILDAICLALYGRTPRLDYINQSNNDIMSRNTPECFAEVIFESKAGRFCCHWAQHRARKNVNGALQSHKHEISDAQTQKIIESKISKTKGVVEEKTGMDYDRFTRSILLAQGDFDTFLKSNDDKKSAILEQITGTGIYSEISLKTRERFNEEKTKLDLLKAEIGGITLLDKEQEAELNTLLIEKASEEEKLKSQNQENLEAVQWLERIGNIENQIKSNEKLADEIQKDIQSFSNDEKRLTECLKTTKLEANYVAWDQLRETQKSDLEKLKNYELQLPRIKETNAFESEFLQTLVDDKKVKSEHLSKMRPVFTKVRTMDQGLGDLKEAILVAKKDKDAKEKAVAESSAELLALQAKLNASFEQKQELDSYLVDHANDEKLIQHLEGVRLKFKSWSECQNKIQETNQKFTQNQKFLENIQKELSAIAKNSSAQVELVENIQKQLSTQQERIAQVLEGKLLREYQAEKDSLLKEKSYISQIHELATLRNTLEDGKECPLCGALEHPFAVGNIPTPDDVELKIEKLEDLIVKVEEYTVEQNSINEKLQAAQRELDKLISDKELEIQTLNSQNEKLQEQKNEIDSLQNDAAGITSDLKTSLKNYGIDLADVDFSSGTEVSKLLVNLEERSKRWQNRSQQCSEIKTEIVKLQEKINSLEQIVQNTQGEFEAFKGELESKKKDYIELEKKRKDLFENKTVDDEEKALEIHLTDLELKIENQQIKNQNTQRELDQLNANIESLTESIEQRKLHLLKQEKSFLQECESIGFMDEKAFLAARLPEEERLRLENLKSDLDRKQQEIQTRLKLCQENLVTEKSKELTEKSLSELQSEQEALQEELQRVGDALTEVKLKLQENENAQKKILSQKQAIEAQDAEVLRWKKLDTLIGSSTGKKFREFAQGLTFETMVHHANQQLVKMSDRYLLVRDENKPLELNVIDNYQGGEVRSTANLSGGESFIVSMTLALGLSQMASHKVRVDSLFLDEGFGTLDENTLETALETLASLHQEGKLIGVISHVPALKERIPTQINIQRKSGGKSKLTGPGVEKI